MWRFGFGIYRCVADVSINQLSNYYYHSHPLHCLVQFTSRSFAERIFYNFHHFASLEVCNQFPVIMKIMKFSKGHVEILFIGATTEGIVCRLFAVKQWGGINEGRGGTSCIVVMERK